MLEKKIEKSVCDYARSRGVEAYKFTSPARSAVPDRLFIATGGRVWLAEFKREGQIPTAAQAREHQRLRVLGMRVYVIDNIPDGRTMVDEMLGDPC